MDFVRAYFLNLSRLLEYCFITAISLRLLALEHSTGKRFLPATPNNVGNRRVIDRWREFHFSQVRYATSATAKIRLDFDPPTPFSVERQREEFCVEGERKASSLARSA